jgi:hypothetical protein
MTSILRKASPILPAVIAIFCAPLLAAEGAPAVTANELIRRTVQNEIRNNDQGPKYMCRQRKETQTGSQIKLLVETRDAMVGMVVANNDQPLSQDQRRAEYGRLEHFLQQPSELEKKRNQEKENAARISLILKALPDAFVYEYDGTETGRPGVGKPGEPLVRLKFQPNPHYDPPTHVEQVLVGMQGVILLDPKDQHIARIDGTLFKEVGFGWGILGHLDRGGHFQVDQADVGNNNWTIARMDLAFTGKVLLFKNIDIKSTEIFSDFRTVPPDLTFAQGIDLVKKQQGAVAQNVAPSR